MRLQNELRENKNTLRRESRDESLDNRVGLRGKTVGRGGAGKDGERGCKPSSGNTSTRSVGQPDVPSFSIFRFFFHLLGFAQKGAYVHRKTMGEAPKGLRSLEKTRIRYARRIGKTLRRTAYAAKNGVDKGAMGAGEVSQRAQRSR